MSKIVKRDRGLSDGQPILETEVVRQWKTQKPNVVVVSAPKPLASAVSAAFCGSLQAIHDKSLYRHKLLEIQCTSLRWMKPDGHGGLIPRTK